MTQENFEAAKKRRGRPKKAEVSDEANELFPDYIPAEQRVHSTEHDVDDLFGNLEGQDLRNGHQRELARESHQVKQSSPYAKKADSEEPAETDTRSDDSEVNKPGSPKVAGRTLDAMIRAEEVAAELVKTKGRWIEGVDNAKAGVPFKAVEADLQAPDMPIPYAQQEFKMRSDGLTFEGMGILDTGDGAQEAHTVPEGSNLSPRDDPASPSFMVCVNKNCRYRENCLRYRMHNKRDLKTVFYPEDCRQDGIFIHVEDSEFTAYEPMSVLESSSTPSF